jgi:two-component SAPR family response regulator
MTLNDLGCLHHLRGEYQEALALYEEGLAVARHGDDPRNQAYITVGMADLYRDVGLYERAGPLYDVGWRLVKETEPSLAVYVLLAKVDMHRWQGDLPRARTVLQLARRLTEERGLKFEAQGSLPVAEGIVLAENGNVGEGLASLSDGIDFFLQCRANRELVRAYFLLAKAYFLAEDTVQSVTALCQVSDVAEEVGTCQFAVAEAQHTTPLLNLGIDREVMVCQDLVDRVEALTSFGRQRVQADVGDGDEVTAYLRIRAFGEGQVIRDGQKLSSSDWQAAMAKELFFYILLHGPLERDAIGVVFWPDLPAKKMRNSFHTTLHRIRRAVGTQAVIAEGGRYRFGDVSYWFDVEEFEALVARARLLPPHDWQAEDLWRRALTLYRGDFLPEVERIWCVSKRESLRDMYIEALLGMGRCYETRREFEYAVDWYRKVLTVDELQERVHRRIIHCYAEAGQRFRALDQYRRCEVILEKELGLRPSQETRQLYERISGGGSG